MKISPRSVWGMGLIMLCLWLPAGSGAAPNCQAIGDDLWKQWHQGVLPRNDATIDKLLKAKSDCPQLGGSMTSMTNDIKVQREKVAEAVDIVKSAVEELIKKPASTGQEGNQ
ncbi:MAG TPA: hypothetical protein VJU02_05680 [Nitrospiraceae bacterium]|nr:hypothetical protein [Nitrospiraceae bacterium]